MTKREATQKVFGLYRSFGTADYIGESISQLEHASQAAQCAIEEGYDDEVVLAAFFHDIGHLCEMGDETASMDGYGVQEHEKLGADFLLSCGFSERMAHLVRSHVAAKRYLCATDPEYYDRLSEASKRTLDFQCGPMTPEEVQAFREHPWFKESIQMRFWDEKAKEVGISVINLADLEERTDRILS